GGVPSHDDRHLFEMLVLEGAQAGLSWATILKKRAAYVRAYDRFDPRKVARYGAADRRRLLADAGIVRNRAKVDASIGNARAFLSVQDEFGSVAKVGWGFVGGGRDGERPKVAAGYPAADARVRRVLRRAQAARLQVRGLDDHVRVHAGGGHGERPPGRLLPLWSHEADGPPPRLAIGSGRAR